MAVKQTEANKKWQEKNKERAKYLSDRSRARNFLKKAVILFFFLLEFLQILLYLQELQLFLESF